MKMIFAAALIAALPFQALAMSAERPDADFVAMATFVDRYCPGIQMNRERARLAFRDVGGERGWNDDPYHRTLARLRVETLKGRPLENCARFWADFGSHGLREPGLIEKGWK